MSNHFTDVELLGHLDGELAPQITIDVERHLDACASCRTRFQALRSASSDASTFRQGCRPGPMASADRDRLARAMRRDVERRSAMRTPMVLAAIAALLFLTTRFETGIAGRSLFNERGALPRSSLTPGAARLVSVERVCGRPVSPPAVPDAVRRQVLQDYSMEHVPADQYELDYLITPELGGLTERSNLWPEPYGLRSWNAHAKDALEARLPQLVCSGELDLQTAQRDIARNWIDAYKKYLNTEMPVQLHASVLDLRPWRLP
jgi:hypothetical protein